MSQNTETELPGASGNFLKLALAWGWRYRLVTLLATGVGVTAGFINSLTTPNQYRSVGKLFVRPGIRDVITPEAAFSGTGGAPSRVSSREAIQNELQVLSAPQLFDKIAQRVGADVLLAPYDPAGSQAGPVAWHTRLIHDFQTWWFSNKASLTEKDTAVDQDKLASDILAASVQVAPEVGASVISFSYVAHSPETARLVVNAALESALEVHREVFDTMSALGAIEQEMRVAEEIARAAEKVLREFRVKNGIYNYESQRDALISYLRLLDERRDAIDMDQGRRTAEREALSGLLKLRASDRTLRGAETVVLNPAYGALAGHLMQLQQMALSLEFEKGTLSDGEYETRRKALAAAIGDTKSRMDKEGMQLKLEGARAENPDYERITTRLDDLEVELKGLDSQKRNIDLLRNANKAHLAEFEALSPLFRTLELDAQQKRATADQLTGGISNMKTVQKLEQLNLSSIQIMHGGTFEPDKIAPRRGQKLVFGALGGSAIGVLLSLLLGWRDPRVRGRQDLLQLGVPSDGLLLSVQGEQDPRPGTGALPAGLAEALPDIDRFWATAPYDRNARDALKVACLPCEGADAGRLAATLAIGLAIHAGERVAYVSCGEDPSWLAKHLEIDSATGWSKVVDGSRPLDDIVLHTTISGLSYVPMGSRPNDSAHPMSSLRFISILDDLCKSHRFVVVELPPLAGQPAGRAVLNVVDAALVVVRAEQSRKVTTREAQEAVINAGTRLLAVIMQPA